MQQSRRNRRPHALRRPIRFASRAGEEGAKGQKQRTDSRKKDVMPGSREESVLETARLICS